MSTDNPRDPNSLRIVDQETGDELAQLGLEARPRSRICEECRFFIEGRSSISDARDRNYDKCEVLRGRYCNDLNPKGECERWEPQPPATVRSGTFRFLLGTTFGGGVVGLAWMFFGG